MNRQTLLGTFGLLTLILAGAAVMRLTGLALDASLYISAVSVAILAHIRYQRALRRTEE